MSDDPAGIINEYLTLVREKLPESIADDVITELETYMLETARDLGDSGQITLESAKKVVAQFGAPGEVADEYRFSMFPETIPEEDIPTEILHDTRDVETGSIIEKPTEQVTITRKQGIDPTVTPTAFFLKSTILTIMWLILVVIVTYFIRPTWHTSWEQTIFLAPLFIGMISVLLLMLQSHDLKKMKVILWSRSYPEWSSLQKMFTLPENSMPDSRLEYKIFDIMISIGGILLFTPFVILGYNGLYVIFIGIPALVLLIARIMIISKKLKEENDHLELAKYEFVVNLSLLVILNASFGWVLGLQVTSIDLQTNLLPIHSFFVIFFGTALLLQVLNGAQYLWWESDDQDSPVEKQSPEESKLRRTEAQKGILSNSMMMFVKISGWLLIFNSIIFYASVELAPDFGVEILPYMLIWLFGTFVIVGLIVALYCVFRSLRIAYLNSTTFIGRRTRLEALIDLIVSSILVVGIFAVSWMRYSEYYLENLVIYYRELFGGSYTLANGVVSCELMAVVLALFGLTIRLAGNILEFMPEYKLSAAKRIKESGIMILFALTFIVGSEFLRYLARDHFLFLDYIQYHYINYMVIAVLIAFQVVSSGIKIREMKYIQNTSNLDNSKHLTESNDHGSIAN